VALILSTCPENIVKIGHVHSEIFVSKRIVKNETHIDRTLSASASDAGMVNEARFAHDIANTVLRYIFV